MSNKTRILFHATDSTLPNRVIPLLLGRLQQGPASDPLWMFPIILNDYVNLQHNATFSMRDLTYRAEEKVESLESPQSTTIYARLHEITRYAMVLCEILEVNIRTL